MGQILDWPCPTVVSIGIFLVFFHAFSYTGVCYSKYETKVVAAVCLHYVEYFKAWEGITDLVSVKPAFPQKCLLEMCGEGGPGDGGKGGGPRGAPFNK